MNNSEQFQSKKRRMESEEKLEEDDKNVATSKVQSIVERPDLN